jgi:ARG and Rhodanese-Phosphatase-superfamily-associated Protein domain
MGARASTLGERRKTMIEQRICERIREVSVGEIESAEGLSIVPLIGKEQDNPCYRLFDETGVPGFCVKEVDEAGSVTSLVAENDTSDRVLLLDGQQLIGCKQNRIVNMTILVPAKRCTPLPVSCVEHGRWSYDRRREQNNPEVPCEPAPVMRSPRRGTPVSVRARKSERMSTSLHEYGQSNADQSAVWRDVEEFGRALRSCSATGSLMDHCEQIRRKLESFVSNVRMPDNAVGLMVFEGERLVGVDLFDKSETLHAFATQLLQSYAAQWIAAEGANHHAVAKESATSALHQIGNQSGWKEEKSPGEGSDWRLLSPAFSACALVWNDDAIVHLQAFPRECKERKEGAADV